MPSTVTLNTEYWRLEVPEEGVPTDVIVIPTVHPIGDRRILRSAQVALDMGFGIHLVWLGGEPGTSRWSPYVHETRLREPRSTKERLSAVLSVFGCARSLAAIGWHIHDFYMLPFAVVNRVFSGIPAVYDVHEHYPQYYSNLVAGSGRISRILAAAIDAFEVRSARALGGASLAAESMAPRFASKGVAIANTPNFPLLDPYRELPADVPGRARRAVHTGTLTAQYGSAVLVDLARWLSDHGSDIEILAIRRFPSDSAKREFEAVVERAGSPKNLRLIDPVPAHEVASILSGASVGLSFLQPSGQNFVSRPTKLYEYVLAGLVPLVSDLPGQRAFVDEIGFGRVAEPDSGAAFGEELIALVNGDSRHLRHAVEHMPTARSTYTWEQRGKSELTLLYSKLFGNPSRG